jgi:8-oxo-dGTP pyrophosphatase MutT (NUDIX family)
MTSQNGHFVEISEIQKRLLPIGKAETLNGLRAAAVLVPLVQNHAGWDLLFTRRTEHVQDHKGQVSFPGGAVEPGDQDYADTALRETFEEIGLERGGIDVLGQMPAFSTHTGYWITPVVGVITPWPERFVLSASEVSRVFTIPVSWLVENAHWYQTPYLQKNGLQEAVFHYHDYDGEHLWGISAFIVQNFIQQMGWIK